MDESTTTTVRETQHLRHGALGGASAIVMAVAGTAPAYSLAASTAVLIGVAALAGPGALLWCGIPMLGIALAFSYLGRADVNAGAAYSWVRKALHPSLGFISGWALVVSATIFMVAAALPAGAGTLSLINPNKSWSTGATTAVGAVWFLVMAAVVAVGISITKTAQWIMSAVEIVILVVVAVMAAVHTSGRHGQPFSWSWFSPTHFTSLSAFSAAALVAAFYYWGWDVTANLGEESEHSRLTALGGIIGVVIVFALFEVYTIETNMTFSQTYINNNSSADLVANLATQVGGGAMGKAMIVAVMLSTIATLETTLIQVSRSLFAMGRDHTLPRFLGKVNATSRTPLLATIAVTGVSLVLFFVSNFLNSVGTIMSDAIGAIGIQIAVYYSLAALAVVVTYRHEIFKSAANFVCIGVLPLIGSLFMLFTLIESLASGTLSTETKWIGVGALIIGLVPMGIYWYKRSPYYTRGAALESEAETAAAALVGADAR